MKKIMILVCLYLTVLMGHVVFLDSDAHGDSLMKKYVRLYTGSDGKTHFEDIEVKYNRDVLLGDVVIARQSDPIVCGQAFFITGNRDGDWHCAPRRQFLFFLEGEMEMEVEDGSIRRFLPGDVLLVEDISGRGHLSRTRGWSAFVVPIEKED